MEHEQKVTVFEGTLFHVDLKSMYGSTPYCWSVSRLPEGIALFSTDIKPALFGKIAPVTQSFLFGVISVKTVFEASIEFVFTNVTNIKDVRDTYVVKLQIIPCENSNFVPYSENGVLHKYGYPCGYQDAMTNTTFGQTNTTFDQANQSFGQADKPFPTNNDEALKYGYPCISQAAVPYGVVYSDNSSPCPEYGYPCAAQVAKPYGVVYSNNSALQYQGKMKYGYPCIAGTAAVEKYGFPECF